MYPLRNSWGVLQSWDHASKGRQIGERGFRNHLRVQQRNRHSRKSQRHARGAPIPGKAVEHQEVSPFRSNTDTVERLADSSACPATVQVALQRSTNKAKPTAGTVHARKASEDRRYRDSGRACQRANPRIVPDVQHGSVAHPGKLLPDEQCGKDISQGSQHEEMHRSHPATLQRQRLHDYPRLMFDKSTILVTGASGNLGSACLDALNERGLQGVPAGRREHGSAWRRLDFTDTRTFSGALSGIERVFLVRPPAIADVAGVIKPFVEAMVGAGVRQVVFVSLIGVEKRPQVPHHKIERLLVASGIPSVMLRPTFFMQNLSGEHLLEIRDHSEIRVPAGSARINFIDAADIGAVAATLLSAPVQPGVRHLDLTGPSGWTFQQIAEALSEELGRPIRYRHPGPIRFAASKVLGGTPLGFAVVMALLYTASRDGSADITTPVVAEVLGRPPGDLRGFIRRNRDLWMPA